MIVTRLNDGTFILGLDAENLDRLKKGQPIIKSLAEFGGKDDVCIVYGETLEKITELLEHEFGQLPESKPLVEKH